MDAQSIKGQKLPLGFTFSFPLKQEGLNIGRLVTWTKGFKCSGVVGNDVVKLLQEACKRRGVSSCYVWLWQMLAIYYVIENFVYGHALVM